MLYRITFYKMDSVTDYYPFKAHQKKIINLYRRYVTSIKTQRSITIQNKYNHFVQEEISYNTKKEIQCHSSDWFKIYEILTTHLAKKMKTINVFLIDGLTGSALHSLEYYSKTKNIPLKWVMSSFYPNDKRKKDLDAFSLMEKYPDNMVIGHVKTDKGLEWSDGNILVNGMPSFLAMYAKMKMDNFNLCIAMNSSKNISDEKKEMENYNIIIGEVETAMRTLSKDGHFIIRLYSFFTPQMLSLITTLFKQFKNGFIMKPSMSSPVEFEVFFVGIEYKGPDSEFLQNLIEAKSNSEIYFCWEPTPRERDALMGKLCLFVGKIEEYEFEPKKLLSGKD